MDDSPDSRTGPARALARVEPRWTRERHERVFAAILERIRRDERGAGKRASGRPGLRLSHAAR